MALFVEGATVLTPGRRDELQELWRFQCERVSEFRPDLIDVYGFTKLQIIIMDPQEKERRSANRIPLDVAIERAFKQQAFHRLVIAFDAHPANQVIQMRTGRELPCLRDEKDFVLTHLAASRVLPEPFRIAARQLCNHYANNRAAPRAAQRPPMGDVELVYMDRTFEAMVLQDVAALRAVFSLKRAPRNWPKLPFTGDRPDFVLREIVNAHYRAGPTYLRLPYDAAKHAWAQEILRNAADTSAIWAHPIFQRLGKVLV